MNHWYVYTGKDLIFGRGRMIQHVIADPLRLEKLIATANKIASDQTYLAALIAALAMAELGETTQETTGFSSLRQIVNLFAGLNIEQVAINFLNGKIASNYNSEDIAQRVAQGFVSGELLLLARDSAKLYSPETSNKLLGILAFLLTKSESERKAFTAYLRRGTPPILSAQDYAKLADNRPTLPSFASELRLLKEDTHAH